MGGGGVEIVTLNYCVNIEILKKDIARANREDRLRQADRCKSPALAHMKLQNSLARRNSFDRLSQVSSSIPSSPLLRKSNLNKGNFCWDTNDS